jgi:dTDP-4-amino-4,6-dideoxygalactose transaminase
LPVVRANPFQVVRDFEAAVGQYTGAPRVVAVNSCTNALFLCLMWLKYKGELPEIVEVPKLTYVSVPMQILHAGAEVAFRDDRWRGIYTLRPTRIIDAARRFTSGMYGSGTFMCTSHHWGKILGVQQGGCILHDNDEADAWFRRARFDGRTEGVLPVQDQFAHVGWHMYLSPEIAAEGLVRLKRNNDDLPMDNYPDLSQIALFKRKPKPVDDFMTTFMNEGQL